MEKARASMRMTQWYECDEWDGSEERSGNELSSASYHDA